MEIPTAAELEAAILAKKWVVHREVGRLNIVVLRKTPGTLDAFDDMLVVFWREASGATSLFACRCTADPGKPSRTNPRRNDGTAVWMVSQSLDGFFLGTKAPGTADAYPCFRPFGEVPVLRYTSVDDPEGTRSTSRTVLLHRASAMRESTVVGPWSEGCTVVANPRDYDVLLARARLAEKLGWRKFTISVLDWR